jgi:hypothetical protein
MSPAAPGGHRVGKIILFDRRANDLRREYLATSSAPVIQALGAVETRPGDWQDQLLAALDALPPGDGAGTAVLIAEAPSDATLHEAGRVARLHPDTHVFVLISDGAGIADIVFDKLLPFQRTLLIDGQQPEDSWIRIARHWHETYRLTHPAPPGGAKEPSRRPWAKLDSFLREDNVLQLRSVMAAAVRCGRYWSPCRSVRPGSHVEPDDREISEIATAEHARWYDRRRAAGWRLPAPGEQDDDRRRVNKSVRLWADLPAEAREGACAQVRYQLAELETVGFLAVLPDGGPAGAASFERSGEVRAERLTASLNWRTAAGDELSARAGDWLVVDEFGTERTVKHREFLASHRSVNGNRWERTGAVMAWQVTEPTMVRTLEGRAVAQPGYWIVQGPLGERWPVPDDQFRRTYTPSQATAGTPGQAAPGAAE